MDSTRPAPVCWIIAFAVPEEAAPFLAALRRLGPAPVADPSVPAGPGRKAWRWRDLGIQVHGMGADNARRVVLPEGTTHLLTCGFAGGLDPDLPAGRVIFAADPGFPATATLKLQAQGAWPGRFHCATRVAITAAEKAALRATSGADAVEMESGILREMARARRIPAATVRVISDPAGEDLPLDFNALMTPDCRLDFGRLLGRIARSPSLIPRLIRFGRQTHTAAVQLATVLTDLVTNR